MTQNTSKAVKALFTNIWHNYLEVTPSALKIHDLLGSGNDLFGALLFCLSPVHAEPNHQESVLPLSATSVPKQGFPASACSLFFLAGTAARTCWEAVARQPQRRTPTAAATDVVFLPFQVSRARWLLLAHPCPVQAQIPPATRRCWTATSRCWKPTQSLTIAGTPTPRTRTRTQPRRSRRNACGRPLPPRAARGTFSTAIQAISLAPSSLPTRKRASKARWASYCRGSRWASIAMGGHG